jgi:hypothetical protein
MISMKRVLVIPSWYPSDENSNIGVFFQEQAGLSRARYDARVMVVRRRVWGRRSFLNWARFRCLSPKLAAVSCNRDVALPVTTVEFDMTRSEAGLQARSEIQIATVRWA